MKTLFLTRRFFPEIGGVEKHVFEIGKRLIKRGYKVIVITELAGNSLSEEIDGIKIYRIYVGKNDWFKKFRIWKNLWHLRKLIKEADIVHCHDVFFWYLPFRLLYPLKPVYTTFHGYESYPISKKAILVRKISEKLSWGNICIGDFINKWYGTKPTYVSYGAIDSSKFKVPSNSAGRQSSKFKKESAVFIGRLDEQTGVLEYIKTYEILKKKYPKFEFAVIGDGKCRKQIEKKVRVLGWQKNPGKYLPKYHFAFVSGYLSILEAFIAKKLVFAVFDNPLKEDYLRMTPFAKNIVITRTPQQLSKKIKHYLEHPEEEKKLIERAFAWAQGQTWEKMASMYLRLWNYKNIL